MAITIVSRNLNTYGNFGQFATDPSTWGFSIPPNQITRSSTQKFSGISSAKIKALSTNNALYPDLAIGRFSPITGGKYLITARVFVPSDAPIADGSAILSLVPTGTLYSSSEVTRTVLSAFDQWVEVKLYVVALTLGNRTVKLQHSDALSIINGLIYVDKFEIYKYTGTPDEEPDPEPEPEGETFDQVYFSKNPIVLSKNAPAGWELLNNFRLYNDLRVQDVNGSGVYYSRLKTELPPSSDGSVIFYLRQAFRGLLNAVPPAINEPGVIRLFDRIKFFKNFSGQLQNNQVTPGVLTESSRMLAMLGGINKQKYPGLNFFSSYLPTTKQFLTWAPVEKQVDRLQEDYLNYWIFDADTTTLKVNIKVYFDDGTDVTQVVNTVTPVAYGQLYQIPAGPSNSGVALIDVTKNIHKYELSILDQDDTLISEVRTYIVDFVRHPLTRFIMFLNSLGSYEVLRFTGQAEFKTDFDREVVQKFLPHNYNALNGEFEVNDVSLLEKVNYSSGFFTGKFAKEWQKYMTDLFMTSRLFDVTTGDRIPISIISSTLDGGADQNFVRFARLDVQKSFIDNCFTPDSI